MSTYGLLKRLCAWMGAGQVKIGASRRMPAFFRAMEALELRTLFSSSLVAAGGKTATFTDLDGDKVTVTVSAGALTADLFTMKNPSATGEQLQALNLTSSTFTGASVTVSVKRVAGGDGLANVGFIDATGVDLGAVSVAGDLGRISAGDGHSSTNAMTSLTVRSMGRLGTDTQAADDGLTSVIKGNLGSLTVKTDIKDAFINVQTAGDGVKANLGAVTIGGSVIGGTGGDSGLIFADGNIGTVKVTGDVVGGAGFKSGGIISGGSMSGVTIGG
ncbi:MAG TPA: hypothetical protein VHM90_11525, partial [Phycisphaerae bacterium]|nr:hypothetical protein [Phycisphaerae bacterium]